MIVVKRHNDVKLNFINIKQKQNCIKEKNYYIKYNFWTPVNKYLRTGPI